MKPRLTSTLALLFFATLLPMTLAGAQTTSVEQAREAVHLRLKSGHSPLAYSQTDEAMAEIHADPSQSGSLVLFYTGRTQAVSDWVSGNPQDGWNREHLWPQSRGTRANPMRTDLFHLMPTDASVNQNRGSLNFDVGGEAEGEAPDTFLDGDSFEPRDAIKGDVARAMFYMDLRYEGTDGEPDLTLKDGSVAGGGMAIGDLCTLLAWHREDPVSPEETERNNLTEAIQGNRNLFIDEPGTAEAIYASECAAPSVAAVSGVTSDSGRRLRIGTWNIANLHHETGVPLRSGSFAREDIDYERLAALAADLDLDIVALQEVGSPRAAERIFPPADYHIVMSDRYQAGDEDRPESERDIFTALVFSKEAFPTIPKTRSLDALSIVHLGLDRDGSPSARRTRAGIVADLTISGEPVRLLGVHLKSFCHRWSLDPVVDQHPQTGAPFSSRYDCRTLRAQLSILESWIEQQAAQGIATIVLGDFNRDMNALGDAQQPIDDFWLGLNDGTPNGLDLRKGPLGTDTVCWPNHADRFDDHIDFVIYDSLVSDLAGVTPPQKFSMGFEDDPAYDDRARQRLSDHCPVVMMLEE